MNILSHISHLLILAILLSNIALIKYGGNIALLSGDKLMMITSIIIIIEAILILIIIKIVYDDPITELELTIKKFLVGQLKGDSKIQLRKSGNKHLTFIVDFFSETLKTLQGIKSEFMRGKEIKFEVDLAREIQSKLLEKQLIEIPSLNVIAKSKPAGEIGGDSYDVIQQDENYYIYVGDATGHGVGAGFIMMMVNALISGFSKIYSSGAEILINTNNILKPRVKANLLMTLLLMRWNEKEKRLFMTGAGHENLIVYKSDTRKCVKIQSGGVALGMIKNADQLLKEQEIPFEKNDIIILYSDGITEAINQPFKDGDETRFGEERLIAAIESAPNIQGKTYPSASNIFNNISIGLSKFMGYKHTQLDDVTLVVVHYRGEEYNIEEDKDRPISDDLITEWKW